THDCEPHARLVEPLGAPMVTAFSRRDGWWEVTNRESQFPAGAKLVSRPSSTPGLVVRIRANGSTQLPSPLRDATTHNPYDTIHDVPATQTQPDGLAFRPRPPQRSVACRLCTHGHDP